MMEKSLGYAYPQTYAEGGLVVGEGIDEGFFSKGVYTDPRNGLSFEAIGQEGDDTGLTIYRRLDDNGRITDPNLYFYEDIGSSNGVSTGGRQPSMEVAMNSLRSRPAAFYAMFQREFENGNLRYSDDLINRLDAAIIHSNTYQDADTASRLIPMLQDLRSQIRASGPDAGVLRVGDGIEEGFFSKGIVEDDPTGIRYEALGQIGDETGLTLYRRIDEDGIVTRPGEYMFRDIGRDRISTGSTRESLAQAMRNYRTRVGNHIYDLQTRLQSGQIFENDLNTIDDAINHVQQYNSRSAETTIPILEQLRGQIQSYLGMGGQTGGGQTGGGQTGGGQTGGGQTGGGQTGGGQTGGGPFIQPVVDPYVPGGQTGVDPVVQPIVPGGDFGLPPDGGQTGGGLTDGSVFVRPVVDPYVPGGQGGGGGYFDPVFGGGGDGEEDEGIGSLIPAPYDPVPPIGTPPTVNPIVNPYDPNIGGDTPSVTLPYDPTVPDNPVAPIGGTDPFMGPMVNPYDPTQYDLNLPDFTSQGPDSVYNQPDIPEGGIFGSAPAVPMPAFSGYTPAPVQPMDANAVPGLTLPVPNMFQTNAYYAPVSPAVTPGDARALGYNSAYLRYDDIFNR